MRNILFALAAASLMTLGGCANQMAASGTKPAEPAKPAITAEAQSALSAAQAAAKDAKSKGALWVTAENALKAAEAAAEKGDSEGVLKSAKTVNEQVKRGLEQANYPVLQLKDL